MKGKSWQAMYDGFNGQSESKGTDGVVFKFEIGGANRGLTRIENGMFPEIYYSYK